MIKLNIHHTDAKYRKTKIIPHMCGTAFSHIGETSMDKFHSDGFRSHMIIKSFDTCNFCPNSKLK